MVGQFVPGRRKGYVLCPFTSAYGAVSYTHLGYITESSESSEDVGERYYDAETRLKTQRTKQERLLALLEQADTMEDIISLENALGDVEYQIEQLSSTLNRYDALISYSTFTIYPVSYTHLHRQAEDGRHRWPCQPLQ